MITAPEKRGAQISIFFYFSRKLTFFVFIRIASSRQVDSHENPQQFFIEKYEIPRLKIKPQSVELPYKLGQVKRKSTFEYPQTAQIHIVLLKVHRASGPVVSIHLFIHSVVSNASGQ